MFFRRTQQPSTSPEDLRSFLLGVQEHLLHARQCFAGQRPDTEPNQQLDTALKEVNRAVQRLSRPTV